MDEKNTPPDPAPKRSLFGISIRVKRATPPPETPETGRDMPAPTPDAPRIEAPELRADLPPEKTVLQALEPSLPLVAAITPEAEPSIAAITAPAIALPAASVAEPIAPEVAAPAIALPAASVAEPIAPEAAAPAIALPAASVAEPILLEVVAPVIALPDAAPDASDDTGPEAEGAALPAPRSRPRISWRARPVTPKEVPPAPASDTNDGRPARSRAGWLSKDRLASLLLILAIVIGGALRLTDLNWDDGKG